MLLEIKDFFSKHARASLLGISQHLDCDPEMMKIYLRHWQAKGCIKKCVLNKSCGSCSKACSGCTLTIAQPAEVYEWVDA